MVRKGGSRLSFTPHSTTARSKNGGMTPFVERPGPPRTLKSTQEPPFPAHRRAPSRTTAGRRMPVRASPAGSAPAGSPDEGPRARVRTRIAGRSRPGPDRLVLEVLLWLLGRYSEQGVTLHVCCKALQRRHFRMTWLEVGARRAQRAVGGAWRDSATMCYSGPGAGRSAGVLPGPVALRALEVASYRHSREQGSGSTTHL